MNKVKRRAFIQSAGLGAITLVAGQPSARAASKGQKCVIGVIGTGAMGSAHLKTLAKRNDAEVAYVCDVNKDRLSASASAVASIAGKLPIPVNDLRKVLDARNVDAV